MSQVSGKYKTTPASKVTEEVEQRPIEVQKFNDSLSKKVEKKDNEQIEITAEGSNDSTVGNDVDIGADLDDKSEVSAEGKLEQEIEQ
jgi:hypothetical protein